MLPLSQSVFPCCSYSWFSTKTSCRSFGIVLGDKNPRDNLSIKIRALPRKEETMNLRGLYRMAGLSAFGYALIYLGSYLAWISASGFLAATSAPPSPDRILHLAQSQGNQLAARLDIASYFLWIPALLGIFVYLRDRVPGRALLGGAFAAFSLVAFFGASALNAGLITLAQGPVSDALKDRLFALSMLAFSSFLPGLWSQAVSNLFWGQALRSQGAPAKTVGNLFLAQIVGFLIATVAFIAGGDMIGNFGILIQTLALVATYASAGRLLLNLSKQEPEVQSSIQEKRRASGTSA
jgi:hypothetical protein